MPICASLSSNGQAKRVLRAGVSGRTLVAADFARAKYVDLVGLAETVTGHRGARRQWSLPHPLPFHDDSTPSLVIYPPGAAGGVPCAAAAGRMPPRFAPSSSSARSSKGCDSSSNSVIWTALREKSRAGLVHTRQSYGAPTLVAV
jgi:hypothetical protein